jgi:hypothetical protein
MAPSAPDRSAESGHRDAPPPLAVAGGDEFPPEVEAPEDGGMRGAQRPAPAASGLPCRNSNNSPTLPIRSGYKLHRRVTYIAGKVGSAWEITTGLSADSGSTSGIDRDGRIWQKGSDGVTWEKLGGGITSAEAKRAFALRMNVEAFFNYYGRDICGFLTFSPAKSGPAASDPKELAKRFDDARKHALRWMRSYFRVLEPRRDGSAHHHLGVATTFNLEPDKFDWDAFKKAQEQAPRRGKPAGPNFQALRKQYVETAPVRLRECWSELREVSKRYGLGRSEFLPLRKGPTAIAHYVAAYLEGGLRYRRDAWKGCRRVEYERKHSVNSDLLT